MAQDQFLQKLLESGRPEDLRTAAKLSSQGYRSYVWREGGRVFRWENGWDKEKLAVLLLEPGFYRESMGSYSDLMGYEWDVPSGNVRASY